MSSDVPTHLVPESSESAEELPLSGAEYGSGRAPGCAADRHAGDVSHAADVLEWSGVCSGTLQLLLEVRDVLFGYDVIGRGHVKDEDETKFVGGGKRPVLSGDTERLQDRCNGLGSIECGQLCDTSHSHP